MFNTEETLSNLERDSDYEELFTSLVEENELSKFSQLEDKVRDIFGEKLDTNLEKFAYKLSLDRKRLKGLFHE